MGSAWGRARGLLGHAPLLVVLAFAALLDTHGLRQNGYANTFYSAGVRSMLESLHNFFFVSFDPGGLVTIDKPALGLWVQAVSAKLFGFDPLSLLLPEAIAGVAAVGALYAIVMRRFGRLAGLIAAVTLAVYPSFVAISRDNNVDAPLILLLVLACGCALRAIESGRSRTLIGAAVLVGLAFNTKTLAAYLVVPGIALGYLLCAPGSPRRRVTQLLVAGLVLAAVSLAWIGAVELTPASQRPFVGGSTDNSELGLAFVYNGFGRVGGEFGGPGTTLRAFAPPSTATEQAARVSPGAGTGASRAHLDPAPDIAPVNGQAIRRGPVSFGGPPGPGRLFEAGMDDQGSWLLPFALLGLVALGLSLMSQARVANDQPAAARTEGSGVEGSAPASAIASTWSPPIPSRRDRRLAALIVLGGFLLVELVVLSFSRGIVHPYYVSAMGPGVAAMTGAGTVALVRSGRVRRAVVALAAIAASVVLQIHLLHHAHYLGTWIPALIVLEAIALVGLIASASHRLGALVAGTLAVGALLVAPAAYSTTTWKRPVNNTFPAAGPRAAGGNGGIGVDQSDLAAYEALGRFVLAHEPGTRFQLLTQASLTAAVPILLGVRAAAIGGYGGIDPALDGPGLGRLVARGEARYVLIGGPYAYLGGNKASQAAERICPEVPPRLWSGPDRANDEELYLLDCRGRAGALKRESG